MNAVWKFKKTKKYNNKNFRTKYTKKNINYKTIKGYVTGTQMKKIIWNDKLLLMTFSKNSKA